MKSYTTQHGMSLIELLIALVVGLTLSSGVFYLFVSTIATQNQNERITRLEEELSSAIDLMVRDIRRAGYDRGSWDYAISASTNAYTSDFDDISYSDLGDGDASFDCILYRYDKNSDGNLDTSGGANSDERFGFKLSNGGDTIEKGYGATSCDAGSWESLTSTWAATITDLDYDITLATVSIDTSSGTSTTHNVIQLRSIDISLTGESGTGADTVTRTITETIRLRNDEMNP